MFKKSLALMGFLLFKPVFSWEDIMSLTVSLSFVPCTLEQPIFSLNVLPLLLSFHIFVKNNTLGRER